MGDEDAVDAPGVDAQPAHLFLETVVVVARVDHENGVALAIEEDVGHPFPDAGDVLVDPAGVQRLEDLLASVHLAHFLFLELSCLSGHCGSSVSHMRLVKSNLCAFKKPHLRLLFMLLFYHSTAEKSILNSRKRGRILSNPSPISKSFLNECGISRGRGWSSRSRHRRSGDD